MVGGHALGFQENMAKIRCLDKGLSRRVSGAEEDFGGLAVSLTATNFGLPKPLEEC